MHWDDGDDSHGGSGHLDGAHSLNHCSSPPPLLAPTSSTQYTINITIPIIMHHAHMPKQRYQHHTTVRTWNHKSGMQPRKVSAKLATTTGWGWGWGYQNVSVFYLHIFPSTSKFCVLIVCIFCFALLLSFMYQINTKIQTHQVDEIFSEKAYSTEGYLSPESFPLPSFMPLGKGKFGTVFQIGYSIYPTN